MSYWGKVIGTMAGFAMGGPVGAVIGAALGHAADSGAVPKLQASFGFAQDQLWGQARMAALLGRRDQLFAMSVVALSAKLAKCDGPVVRAEIDAFKRQFRTPAASAREIGRLFDQARDSPEGFEPYAAQLGEAFADSRGLLEDVLGALFSIARADGPVNPREQDFLARVHSRFGLDRLAWDQAAGQAPRRRLDDEPDPYSVLGVARGASDEVLRATWKRLMRDNHPDSLAARGVPAEFVARATATVARINAAWDVIKRERSL